MMRLFSSFLNSSTTTTSLLFLLTIHVKRLNITPKTRIELGTDTGATESAPEP